MPPVLTRRSILSAAVALAGPLPFIASVDAAGDRQDSRRPVSMQSAPELSIAVLATHWTALQPLVEAYEESTGIDVDATPLGYDDLYTQTSLALTQRAQTFDVVFLHESWIPQFATFLQPLDVPPNAGAIAPVAMGLAQYPEDARPCALPWLGETQFFALRPDWLRESELPVPERWDTTVEVASTMAAHLQNDGELAAFGLRTRTGHELVESFLPILRGYGASIIDAETSVPQLDTPPALAAIETFLTLAGLSPIESKATGDLTNPERFAVGRIGMMANYWSSDLLGASNDLKPTRVASDELAAELETALQPAQPGIERQVMTGIWLAGIPAGALQREYAGSFLQWLVSLECQQHLPAAGFPPVRMDVLDSAETVEIFPKVDTARRMLERATPRVRSPFFPQLEQLLASELFDALGGNTTGSEALRNANLAIREFLVREGVLDA